MAVELLQRVGLSKYEAEAYYVLLLQGPLTGYELGKRSVCRSRRATRCWNAWPGVASRSCNRASQRAT